MKRRYRRLYDEQLVKDIMVSASLLTYDFLKEKVIIDEDDICEFIEENAENIIEDTINEMNEPDSTLDCDADPLEERSDFWNE